MADSPVESNSKEEAQLISQNISRICAQLAQFSVPSSSLPALLEESTAVLEELQVLLQLVGRESTSVKSAVSAIEKQFAGLEPLWDKIESTAGYVNQKKEQLSELESLCTCVERLIKEKQHGRGATTRRESDIGVVEKETTPPMDEEFSDDDAPVEVTSKKPRLEADIALVEDEPVEKSLFEQIVEQKKEEEERKKDKAKSRRIKRRKVDDGTFAVKVQKAEFKVVALDKGVSRALEPVRNYKADLLLDRTADRRLKGNAAQFAQRAKWASKN